MHLCLLKVGALEVKLMSCRNIVKETSPGGGGSGGTGSTPGSGSATPGQRNNVKGENWEVAM